MDIIYDEVLFDFFKSIIQNLSPKEKEEYVQVLTPNSDSPLVVHNKTAQLTIVLSGTGIVGDGKEQYSISGGKIILIKASCPHEFIALNGDLKLLHIHIPYETILTDRKILREG